MPGSGKLYETDPSVDTIIYTLNKPLCQFTGEEMERTLWEIADDGKEWLGEYQMCLKRYNKKKRKLDKQRSRTQAKIQEALDKSCVRYRVEYSPSRVPAIRPKEKKFVLRARGDTEALKKSIEYVKGDFGKKKNGISTKLGTVLGSIATGIYVTVAHLAPEVSKAVHGSSYFSPEAGIAGIAGIVGSLVIGWKLGCPLGDRLDDMIYGKWDDRDYVLENLQIEQLS